jgi:hypothetical protein
LAVFAAEIVLMDLGVELTTENRVRVGAAVAISGDENSDAHKALESNRSAICGSN